MKYKRNIAAHASVYDAWAAFLFAVFNSEWLLCGYLWLYIKVFLYKMVKKG